MEEKLLQALRLLQSLTIVSTYDNLSKLQNAQQLIDSAIDDIHQEQPPEEVAADEEGEG